MTIKETSKESGDGQKTFMPENYKHFFFHLMGHSYCVESQIEKLEELCLCHGHALSVIRWKEGKK